MRYQERLARPILRHRKPLFHFRSLMVFIRLSDTTFWSFVREYSLLEPMDPPGTVRSALPRFWCELLAIASFGPA